MAKIHGLVYILVGLFVSIFSWRLNYEKLIFFFYAGWIFVFIGVVKLIFNLIKTKMNKKEKIHHKSVQQHVKFCHNCGIALRQQAKFCARCGARV
ncbi:zinc ribbon domain-containing protein [Candidatus Woesearchaeota archaeon]|nr:zinc ribbon domain-containing protein [Candidatus Woesearchaeota archaeon]